MFDREKHHRVVREVSDGAVVYYFSHPVSHQYAVGQLFDAKERGLPSGTTLLVPEERR